MATLAAQGHEVKVSDLYGMGFKAIPDADDFTAARKGPRPAPDRHRTGAPARDRQLPAGRGHRADQGGVAGADLMIFQFPIWWFSMPAILKGWVERVMARGFAYGGGRKHARGVFLGRKAMVCCTTGTSADTYSPDGIEGDILHLLWPVNNGIFHYMASHLCPLSPPSCPVWPPSRNARSVSTPTPSVCAPSRRPPPSSCTPARTTDPTSGCAPVEARSGFQWNPRAGQTHAEAATGHSDLMNRNPAQNR